MVNKFMQTSRCSASKATYVLSLVGTLPRLESRAALFLRTEVMCIIKLFGFAGSHGSVQTLAEFDIHHRLEGYIEKLCPFHIVSAYFRMFPISVGAKNYSLAI